MHHLLLIEDEASQAESLYPLLANGDCTVTVAHTPRRTRDALAGTWPDAVIFNLQSAQVNWADVNRAVVQSRLDLPRLAVVNSPLPANLTVEAILRAPCTVRQLMERLDRIIEAGRFLRFRHFTLDTRTQTILRGGEVHHLTPKLFRLLMLLIRHEGQIAYRKTIMHDVWDTDYMGDTRTLDVHIHWLRRKIEANPAKPQHILTVRGAGYRFMGHANG